MLMLACLAGCGGRGDGAARTHGSPANLPDLEAVLEQEFQRLGIDPNKVTAKVAAGEGNAVFDLAATLLDPDGEGPRPVEGVQLSWTERSIGDYDGNGEVGISDLTPLGQHFTASVEYAADSVPEYLPVGDPDGAGSANWLKARVDGDGNGQLNISDITPIAQHWNERISGYRVYRKGPQDSDFKLLPNPVNPSLAYSIQRQFQAGQLVRYSFSDEPPLAGEYEYLVRAYDASAADTADEQSNIAGIEILFGFADTEPPVWDTTVGVQSAVANTDGTVSIGWGRATDISPAGVLPNPPVTYNIYYSTQTPLDFGSASRISGLEGNEWISPQLVDGSTYYFAVRTQDSFSPPNEDQNTTELTVTIIGGLEDTEPPIWTDYGYLNGDEADFLIEGISEVLVNDGSLTVKLGKAAELLSPPIYYDLYYYSDREFRESSDAAAPTAGEVMEVGGKIESIPTTFDFEWENRHKVWLTVTVRDSANPPNVAVMPYATGQAPSDLFPHEIDPDFPGLAGVDYSDVHSGFDPFTHHLYFVYAEYSEDRSDLEPIHCVDLNCMTGQWTHTLVGYGPEGANVRMQAPRISPAGEIWVVANENYGPFNNLFCHHRRKANGQWEEVRLETWSSLWLGQFDHNGFPTHILRQDSEVYPGERYKYTYLYYDQEVDGFKEELVADPGGAFEMHVRPDGSMAVVMRGDGYPPEANTSNPPLNPGRVFNRSVSGVWTKLHEFPDSNLLKNGGEADQWHAEWKWAYGLDYTEGSYHVLCEDNEGIKLLGPFAVPNYGSGLAVQQASGNQIHLLAGQLIWNGSEHCDYEYNRFGISFQHPRPSFIELDEVNYNREDGFLCSLQAQPDPDGSGWKWYVYSMEAGTTMYDVNP